MNRVTVITIALAILLAHALAIHQSADGTFAPPYEIAHVAFRIARNAVHHGSPYWLPGGQAVESYPSPLWILACWVPERLYVSPTVFTQGLGIVSGLGAVVLLAQFSPKRLAGLVAPLLLAASGSAAAAASSGTEAPLAMFLATGTFLAFERRWRRALVLFSCLFALTRPEAGYFLVALGILALLARRRGDATGRGILGALVPAAATLALASIVRWSLTGTPFSPLTTELFSHGRARLGAAYVWSFLTRSGTGPLILLPVAVLCSGKFSGVGRRALLLSAVWLLTVALSGGDGLPFWNALAPILPLFHLSVQEAFRDAIDEHAGLAPVLTGALCVAVAASFLVSKLPGDIGPLPVEALQRRWLAPPPALAEAYARPLGRLGLAQEVADVERLRSLSTFLRDNTSDSARILTIWPGAIGYLSRKPVFDLLGRAYPAAGETRTHSWSGKTRVDVVAAIQAGPDYVVALIDSLGQGLPPLVLLGRLLDRYDVQGNTPSRLAELVSAFRSYEMIAVPVAEKAARPEVFSASPFFLLRRRDLELAPRVSIRRAGSDFLVQVQHEGHLQIVDLEVWMETPEGERLTLVPTGEFVPDLTAAARTDVLLHPTGQRPVLLVRQPLPDAPEGTRLYARLVNPGLAGERALVVTGRTDSMEVPPGRKR